MRMPSMSCGSAMQTRQGAAGIRKARQHRVFDAHAALVDKKAAAHRQTFEAAHPCRQSAACHAALKSRPAQKAAW